MRKSSKLILVGGALVALAVPSVASASVDNYLPEAGTGFVGKGDVQTPFGWNDQALQSKASGVTFTYESKTDDTYAVTCEWDTGTKHIVHHVQNKSANLTDSVAYDVSKVDRKNPNQKVTGFNLTGNSNVQTSSEGTVPHVGDACPETGNVDGSDASVTKLITGVETISSTTEQKLMAHHNVDNKHAVLNWPVAPVL